MEIHTFDTEDEFLKAFDGKIYAINRILPNGKSVYLCDVGLSTLKSFIANGYITDELTPTCTNNDASFVFDNRIEIIIKELVR